MSQPKTFVTHQSKDSHMTVQAARSLEITEKCTVGQERLCKLLVTSSSYTQRQAVERQFCRLHIFPAAIVGEACVRMRQPIRHTGSTRSMHEHEFRRAAVAAAASSRCVCDTCRSVHTNQQQPTAPKAPLRHHRGIRRCSHRLQRPVHPERHIQNPYFLINTWIKAACGAESITSGRARGCTCVLRMMSPKMFS